MEPGLLKTILAAVQKAPRKIRLSCVADAIEGMSNMEVSKLLADARKFVTDGPHAYTGQMQPAMSRGEPSTVNVIVKKLDEPF